MSPAPKGKPKLRKRLDRPSVLEAARNYLRRGWTPVPLPDGAKGPKQKGWPELCQQITKANAADHFDNVFGNIGVKLGADSDGLIDVDLDCKEACRLAPYILPPTLTYGRPSKPRSHWLYKSQRLHTLVERATLQFTDLDGSMLVELRVGGGGKAAQTMVPPSFHPSGELVAWTAGETEPFPVENDADFLTGIKIFAAAILLARHYPAEGGRHEAALVMGGVFARFIIRHNARDNSEDAVTSVAENVASIVGAIATVANDPEVEDRAKAAAGAVGRLRQGQEVPGIPRLGQVFCESVANRVAEWLSLHESKYNDRVVALAHLDRLEYDRQRHQAAEALQVRVSTLDNLVEECRGDLAEQARKAAAEAAKPSIDQLEATARPILKSTNVLELFANAIREVITGEQKNVKLLYLIATSRLFSKPMSVAIKGPSAAGKSEIREHVLRFFPNEHVISFTALSDKALLYMKDGFQHKVLSMGEAISGKEVEFQDYLLRELISSGKLKYPVAQKDEHGKLVTITIEKDGPVSFMVTTTRAKLHHENETRMLSIEVDDSEAQTRAVMRKVAETVGLNLSSAVDLQPWHDFQRLLAEGPRDVVVPYAKVLSDMIPSAAVRLRRDFNQLLEAIKAHALIHQRHRKRAKGVVVATIKQDYRAVRELMYDLLATAAEVKQRKTTAETVEAVRQTQPDLISEGATSSAIQASPQVGPQHHLSAAESSR